MTTWADAALLVLAAFVVGGAVLANLVIFALDATHDRG